MGAPPGRPSDKRAMLKPAMAQQAVARPPVGRKGGRPAGIARFPQPAREGFVLAAVALGAAAVLAMWWWADTPASSLADLASKVTAAGRVTGLLGTYLVLVEVVLMGPDPVA
jgi:ferric-dicitrate binding protein FerR (iron transport regulator)